MKRPILFSSVLCLVLGLLCGTLLPTPWDRPAAPVPEAPTQSATAPVVPAPAPDFSSPAIPDTSTLDPADNAGLLSAAYAAMDAIKEHDYAALSALSSSEKGITFTPYSFVNPETDIVLSSEQLKNASTDETVYTWGFVDGRGSLIEMTISEYFEHYVFDADYTLAPQIGIDTVLITGNALENITEAYPGCRFVDFSYPTSDPVNQGLDWCSLKLVFEPAPHSWRLVGIVHGQWTI